MVKHVKGYEYEQALDEDGNPIKDKHDEPLYTRSSLTYVDEEDIPEGSFLFDLYSWFEKQIETDLKRSELDDGFPRRGALRASGRNWKFIEGPLVHHTATELQREQAGLAADVHTERISIPGERFVEGQLVNVETNAKFKPARARGRQGEVGLLSDLAQYPVFKEGRDNVHEAMVSGFFAVKPADGSDDETKAQHQQVAADLRKLLNSKLYLEFLEGCFENGFSLWEIIDSADGSVASLAYVRANTVEEWIVDDKQRTHLATDCDNGETPFTLPAEHTLLYSHKRTGMNLEGVADVRSVAVLIQMARTFMRLTGFAGEAHGLGIKTLEEDKDGAPASKDKTTKMVQMMGKVSAKENPVIKLAPGVHFKWHSPSSGMPNFIPIIEYLDKLISLAATSSGALIGFQDYGSKALAETKDTDKLRSARFYALLFCELLNDNIIPRIMANRFGDDAREMPALEFRTSMEVKDIGRYKRLMTYVAAKMLTWDRTLENELRKDENLPLLGDDQEAAAEASDQPEPADPDADAKESAAEPFNSVQRNAAAE